MQCTTQCTTIYMAITIWQCPSPRYIFFCTFFLKNAWEQKYVYVYMNIHDNWKTSICRFCNFPLLYRLVWKNRWQELHLRIHIVTSPWIRWMVLDPCNTAAATIVDITNQVRLPGWRSSRLPLDSRCCWLRGPMWVFYFSSEVLPFPRSPLNHWCFLSFRVNFVAGVDWFFAVVRNAFLLHWNLGVWHPNCWSLVHCSLRWHVDDNSLDWRTVQVSTNGTRMED